MCHARFGRDGGQRVRLELRAGRIDDHPRAWAGAR